MRARWATTGLRIAVGTLVAAGVVVGTATAVAVPWPGHGHDAVKVAAAPQASDSTAVCAGPLLALGRDASAAAGLSIAAPQDVVAGAAAGAELFSGTLVAPAVDGADPAVHTAPPAGRELVPVAAAGSASVADDDLAGFAASACTAPLLDSWLVGGSSTTGAADLVLIANPGEVAASVELTVYTATGAQTPPGGSIVVAPGTQRIVTLAGLVLGEERPVVHVAATGAPVSAALQSSVTRTLTPTGVDQVAPIATPEEDQTIPGLAIVAEPGAAGASETSTVVRLLAPTVPTTATVEVTRAGGSEPATTQEVPLEAGIPAEIEVSGLAVGTYTVRVTADAAVVAAAWHATGFDEGADFAWSTSAPELTEEALVAVASGSAASIVLANDSGQDVVVHVADDAGAGTAREVAVPAGGAVAVAAARGEVYALRPDAAGVHAAVVYAADGAVASYPVWPADAAAGALTVYP